MAPRRSGGLDPVKPTYERKLLTDTIKMGAYDVETQLMEMLDGVFRRNDWEGRAVVREIFQTSGDLTLSPGQLHIRLDRLSAPRYTQAMMSSCDQVNALDMTLPETDFHLRFHVNPRPATRHKRARACQEVWAHTELRRPQGAALHRIDRSHGRRMRKSTRNTGTPRMAVTTPMGRVALPSC